MRAENLSSGQRNHFLKGATCKGFNTAVVPKGATFEYRYTNRATAFLWLYSTTNTRRYEYGYFCANYGNTNTVLMLEGTKGARGVFGLSYLFYINKEYMG